MTTDINKSWQNEVIYQIYPRSFFSSNGDAVGDIPGITAKLGYLKDLGIDKLWLSPFFKSPMKDYGYDIADYCAVDPLFGSNKDFDELVQQTHNQEMKIIIDQVYNHTSDQHDWFKQAVAKQGKDERYVWADAQADGSPPNNWLSIFGGSAWQWEPRRAQYYLHQFLKEQPDLNFNNEETQKAILEVADFWLSKGVDGFRLDTAHCYTQDPQLRSNPPAKEDNFFGGTKVNPYFMQDHLYDIDYKRNLPFIEKLRAVADKYPGSFMVGEVGGNEQLDTLCLYTKSGKRLHSVYIFCFLSEFNAADLYKVFTYLDENLGDGYPCWAFSNHDVTRVASRGADNGEGNNEGREEVAPELQADYTRFMMTLLLTMRGVPCIYQGEELGLPEADIAFEDLQDPYGKQFWPEYKGRDGCRTPMPWTSDEKYGGFSQEKPWLPIPDQHLKMAADLQEKDKSSMLWFTRAMLQWRKQESVLQQGSMKLVEADKDIFAFVRELNNKKLLCVFNYSPHNKEFKTPYQGKQITPHSFFNNTTLTADIINMPPYGVCLIELK